MAVTQGDFIVHVDSDDWIEPDMIECLVQRQLDTQADIVSCNAIAHYSNRIVVLEEPDYESKDAMIRHIIQMSLDHVIWRRLIRTSLYKDNNISAYEGINIGEDHYTLPRLLFYAKSFEKCNKSLYHYNCMNHNSYTQVHKNRFNIERYYNDRESIKILYDFFMQHDNRYIPKILAVKTHFIYMNFFQVIKVGKKEMYKVLCDDWRNIPMEIKLDEGLPRYRIFLLDYSYYYINRFRVWMRILFNKVFKIEKYYL